MTENNDILVLAGDGIGTEVVPVARQVMEATGGRHGVPLRFQEGLVGGAAIDAAGAPLPAETLALAKSARAVLLGSV
ncbi:MAG: 3-isopropylmalate dehydrogenase, partial [Gammaproteobacteria bacterium]|nr:3-isopropylmalate dehydrogenase [Gammaproteobacteria bacterium]